MKIDIFDIYSFLFLPAFDRLEHCVGVFWIRSYSGAWGCVVTIGSSESDMITMTFKRSILLPVSQPLYE